jgi:DNA replication and repair protein RecF
MALAQLCVEDLRCIEKAELELGPGTHLIFGANGAGKTSLLEAAFVLGRGRSFRTRQNERLIRHGCALLRVLGRTSGDALPHTLGVEVARERGTRARVDAQNVRSLAELTAVFPVQALDPDAHKLIEESAARRRRWLDWAVFHVEPGFADAWGRYSRALQQRNAALRSGLGDVEVWDPELAREGEKLSEARYRVLAALKPYWAALSEELIGVEVALGFSAGWDRGDSLAAALAAGMLRDRERRSTVVGPHRADVLLRVRGRAAREVLSRGQQKLAAVALTLCQLEYLKAEHGLRPTLLLDDPSAELDQERLGRFIARVRALDTQLIITALDRDYRLFGEPQSMFHVEQGRVTRL